MVDTDRNELAHRWPRTVRAGGRPEAAGVLETWLAADAERLAPLVAPRPASPEALLRDAGEAFARLGGAMRAAGLDLDALDAAIRALDDGPAGVGDRAGLATLHGLAAGGWHADVETVGSAPPSDPFAIDPALGKLIRHDIKTPLQAASLNLELLAMEQEGNPDVTGAIATIMQSLDAAVEMLQRFDNV